MTQPVTTHHAVAATATEAYPGQREGLPPGTMIAGSYEVRFARTEEELDEILRLRFEVFNLELGEGLGESHLTGRDEDELDRRFHHLMIVDRRTGMTAGTYRMQTTDMAFRLGGFYTGAEFDLATLPGSVIERSVEIGRACVAKPHRNGRVLHLLWRGLASYLAWNRKSVLFGCCSLTSQDPTLGISTLALLEAQGHLHPTLRVSPLTSTACTAHTGAALPPPHIPALFQSYLNLGAKVCGPPAIDRRFQTIDFLVLLDVETLDARTRRTFFR